MNILVLGASGFLGGKVYTKLKENLTFKTKGTYFNSYQNNDLIQMDIQDKKNISDIIHKYKPDVVIWCLLDINNEKELTNIGLPNILNNISDTTKFIYISTDAFADGQGNYSEETPLKNYISSNPLSKYINAKIKGERIVENHKNNVIIRTGPLYGKNINDNWDKRTSYLINSLSQNQTLQRSSNLYKTFVCVDDLSDLISEMIKTQFTGIIHAGPQQKESYYSFNQKMAIKLGLNANLIIEDVITVEDKKLGAIPLDTSMDTSKCREIFKINFRSV